MRTVTLKIVGSALAFAHPQAAPGPDHLIYAIRNVPPDVPPQVVARKVHGITLAHRRDDLSAWSYEWAELAHLPFGAMVNRY